jgi:lipoate-protein ligase A
MIEVNFSSEVCYKIIYLMKINLLTDTARSGAENMAIDEALGEWIIGREGEIVIRFYGWEPPTLSIGYNQPVSDLDLEELRRDGLGWVRRMTGGGGVLHWNEITYCIALPYDRKIGFSRQDLFTLCAGILSGCYHSLGIDTVPKTPGAYTPIADCFAAPGAFELVEKTTGKKIAGSASTIKRGYFLQHGSLPIDDTHRRIGKYLTVDSPTEAYFEGSVSIDQFVPLSREEVLSWFCGYLIDSFEVSKIELSKEMLSNTRQLAEERYGADDWRSRK